MKLAIFVNILVYSMLYCCVLKVNCNNIIGCGGFFRTELKNFSFSKLSAHLLFSDGTLNYITDILPNGAYSIPVYDFGSYIVKLIGPEGWSVEPESGHRLEVNSQESCSDDYNFSFAGFSIFGKVSTAYINYGPSGIFIELLNNTQIISQITTVDGGNFTINRVFPGNYSLHFKSETSDGKIVELNDTKYIIEIKNDNLYIKDSFIIYGYPVIGDVKFYDEPIKDVEFFIFSRTIEAKHFNYSRYNCISFENVFQISEYNALCKAISNYNGEFMFPLLPGGKYLIIPKYNEVSSYDLHPENYSFEIQGSSVDLRSIFKIIGFSVIGRVTSFNGDPISNAEIYIDDHLLTKTDKDGNFSIKGVTNGNHKLTISIEGFIFNSSVVDFNPTHPNIGIFFPTKISICGSIIIQNYKSIKKEMNEFSTRRKILLINATSGDIVDHIYTQLQNPDKISIIDNNMINTFCFFSKPGLYIVKPILESPIIAHSLAPSKIKILLDSIPVTVKFSPFRGSISGNVKCLQRCNAGEFEVTLNPKEEIVDLIQLTQHVSISEELTNEGYFQFKEVVPGDYRIELISTNNHIALLNNRWCWSQTIFNVNIVDNDVNGLIFEQVGYSLPIQSSHDLKINYFYLNNSVTHLESKNLSKGLSQICLSNPGKYKIQVESCYKLENFSYFIDSREICGSHFDFLNPICHLKINVMEFKVRVNFELLKIDDATDLLAHVKGILDIDFNSHLKNIKWDNNNKGYINFWVKPDVNVNVSVNSSRYLVKPKTISLKLSRDTSNCLTTMGTFKLESGTFINGSISPPIEGVFVEIRQKVSILNDDDIEYIVASSKTNENGVFGFGPLNSSYKYELKLSKSGYKIVENFNSGNNFYFKAYKLAELIVKVIDVTGKALSGILLSIIGNDLRKNELTNEEGLFIFVGLTPGIYYLRAMMKELEFFPNGAVEVIIAEGSTENILIKATRTSFSLHGKVVSLNGEPESGVTVEGDSIKDIKNYQSNCKFNLVRNEHATTDENGIFRIRGLQPDCYYKLSIKKIGIHDDYVIMRSYPKQIIIKMEDKDVYNIKIFALHNVNNREISAMVWTSEIFQSSLHLLVFPSDNPENIITVHKYSNEGIFFQMNLPPIHKRVEYIVRLQSNLNPNIYSNISAQEKSLIIEAGETKSVYKHFEFHFYPIKKLIGESDIAITLSSSLILPFIILLISILIFQKDMIEPLISKILKILKLHFLHTHKQTNITLHPNGANKSNIFDAVEISELNDVIVKSKFLPTVAPTRKLFWSKSKKA